MHQNQSFLYRDQYITQFWWENKTHYSDYCIENHHFLIDDFILFIRISWHKENELNDINKITLFVSSLLLNISNIIVYK